MIPLLSRLWVAEKIFTNAQKDEQLVKERNVRLYVFSTGQKLLLLRQIAFEARCKTNMLSGLIRKSLLAPLFQRGGYYKHRHEGFSVEKAFNVVSYLKGICIIVLLAFSLQ